MRIFIVGDALMTEFSDMLIQQCLPGCTTLTCSDGITAVEQAITWGPDMIFVMNILLPGMNGLELCWKLRAAAELEGVKIVVSSAMPATVDSLLAGASAFLPKVFAYKDMEKLIKELTCGSE